MADGERSALGLSVGATNLAAVTADRSVTRKPVLTLYRQRPPEVGVPSENAKLNEPGLVITDFVDRVGDPAGIPAADNTIHRSETLVADALRALAHTATDGRPMPEAVAVTHPAHWKPAAVTALRTALSRVSEWSRDGVVLLPDSEAALTALQTSPGLPGNGVVALCDFGGSGTTVSLLEAGPGFQAVAPPVRFTEFSGDRLDQALLTHVVNNLSTGGSFDASATSGIGSLQQLRAQCRYAKERLSSTNTATLSAELPGHSGDIVLTREELEDAIRDPLDGFVVFFHEVLQRSGIQTGELAAVASVGGGAAIPLVTRTLSEQSGALVVSAPRPHLTASVGAALRAARGPGDAATAMAPTALGSVSDATMISQAPVEPAAAPALAWSEADDDSGIMPLQAGEYDDVRDEPPPRRSAAPVPVDEPEPFGAPDPWYRRPLVVALGTALAVLILGSAVLLTLRHTSNAPSAPTSTTVSTAPESSAATTPSTSAGEETTNPPSSAEPVTTTPAPSSSEAPSTTTTTTEAPTTSTTTVTTTSPPSSSQGPFFPDRPRFPRGPGRLFPEPGQGGR